MSDESKCHRRENESPDWTEQPQARRGAISRPSDGSCRQFFSDRDLQLITQRAMRNKIYTIPFYAFALLTVWPVGTRIGVGGTWGACLVS